jgi:hypothetical protein
MDQIETEICNRLLRLLGKPEAVEMFMASPQPLLHGQRPQALLDSGQWPDVLALIDQLQVRLA